MALERHQFNFIFLKEIFELMFFFKLSLFSGSGIKGKELPQVVRVPEGSCGT